MDRSLFAQITAISMGRMQELGFSMPNQRFFTPVPAFWDALRDITRNGAGVIEVGAGSGDMFFDGIHEGFSIQGIDTIKRDGANHVLIADATSFPYKAGMLVLCCRPDHSGWSSHAMARAIECGASFLYAGLARNFERDFTDDDLEAVAYRPDFEAGEEGEVLLGWGPLFQGLPQ